MMQAKVLARKVENAAILSEAAYFTVTCLRGSCRLQVVTINNCVFGANAQWPLVETASTIDGDLAIDAWTTSEISVTWTPRPESTTKLKFVIDPQTGKHISFSGSALTRGTGKDETITLQEVKEKSLAANCPFHVPK